MKLDRPATQRDLVLYIPDQLLVVGYDDTVARQVPPLHPIVVLGGWRFLMGEVPLQT